MKDSVDGGTFKVLVINCGSTTIKFQVIDTLSGLSLAGGGVDRIGRPDCLARLKPGAGSPGREEALPGRSHGEALKWVFDALPRSMAPAAVGHRVVHGGSHFSEAAYIDEDCLAKIEDCSALAPLHNPVQLEGIRECMRLHPEIPQVACFDTAFHEAKPELNAMYGLPREWSGALGYRKFGFHGASHKYVSRRAAELLGRELGSLRLVTCHLGGGSSVAAVERGIAIDTSATFGTCTGMPMGTRSGDIDAGVILDLLTRQKMSPEAIHDLLYKRSGMLGISGVTGDMAELARLEAQGHAGARLARDYFVYCLKHFIGAYAAAMDGVEGIVFTAGIGENDRELRERVCLGLGWLGASLDLEKNRSAGREALISTDDSRVAILVIPTNEEGEIAREVAELIALGRD